MNVDPEVARWKRAVDDGLYAYSLQMSRVPWVEKVWASVERWLEDGLDLREEDFARAAEDGRTAWYEANPGTKKSPYQVHHYIDALTAIVQSRVKPKATSRVPERTQPVGLPPAPTLDKEQAMCVLTGLRSELAEALAERLRERERRDAEETAELECAGVA